MTYLVIGGGAVGSFLASTLGRNGARVFLKCRSRPRPEVSRICARAGVDPVISYREVCSALTAGPPLRAIFVATKTYHLHEAVAELRAAGDDLRPTLATVGCYNGQISGAADLFGPDRVFCKALVPGGYTLRADGTGFEVTNGGQKWSLLSRAPEVRELAGRMSKLGVPTIAGGFEADTRKFLVNLTANLLSVVVNTNCAGLVGDRHLLARMRAVCAEAAAVLRASPEHRDHFPAGLSPEELEQQIIDGIAAYGHHYPSSCKDFQAGRPVEVDSLNGYVVTLGRRLGMLTPANAAVVDDVKNVMRRSAAAMPPAPRTVRTPRAPVNVRVALRAAAAARTTSTNTARTR